MSNKIFVTSDLHLGHRKEFLYEPRGFSSIEEHNEAIINNWNEVVGDDDIVYLLGDSCMGTDLQGAYDKLSKLKGQKYFLRGNHCSDNKVKIYEQVGTVLGWSTMIKVHKQSIYLSHYPCLCDNYDSDKPLKAKILNVCGHRHVQDKWFDWDKGLIYHVELDAHNNYPVDIEQILTEVRERYEKKDWR